MTTNPMTARPNSPRGQGCGMAGWLALAASPSFAVMAWLTAGTGAHHMMGAGMAPVSPLGGMPLMYLLMSLFHLSPWLGRAPGRGRHPTRTATPTEGN